MAYTVEHFDGGSLPSPWSAITAGTGTITVSDSGVVGELAASSDSAAIVRAFDHTTDAIYWYCAAARYNGATGPTPWPAMRLMHSASTPVAGARSSFTIAAQHTYYNTGGTTYVRTNYSLNPGGTNQQWQESSQSFTTGGTVISMPAGAAEGDYRLYGMQWDATNSRVRWMAGHTEAGSTENPDYGPRIVMLTDWVDLSNILNGTSSTLWLVLGWPENNFYTNNCSFHIEWFSEQTGPLVHTFCNGKASVGGTYNITHHVGHDLRAPYFVPGTRAQIAIDKGTSGQWDDVDTQWGSAILADDGNYVQSYAGDGGSTVIQIGIATATTPYGPWTKSASNPVIAVTPSTDYSAYMRFNVLVEDWQESDPNKRYKLIVNANDGSDTRTILFYAADYEGPYTYDGRLLEEDATETGIAFRGQPIWEGGQWYLLYNCTVGGQNVVRYATCATLRAGQAVKANTTLNTQSVGAVEVTLTAVSGRTWTCADTTGLVKDMLLVCTQTASADTYDLTRVRKVISSTQFEVYHTAPAAASGTVCRSANYGTDNALNHVIKIDGTWHFVMTVFKAFTSHASYSAHHETNGLFVGGSSITDAMAIDWMATPIAPLGRDAWNTTVSNENMRVLHTPLRIYTLTADAASFTLTGTSTGLTADRTLTASPASFTLTGVDAGLTYTPIGGYTLTADAASFALTGTATGITATRTLPASAATFTLTGTTTALTAARTLTAATASYALTGVAAGLTYTPVGAYTLTADAASFTLSGVAAGLTATRTLTASAASYTLTGVAAGLTYSPAGSYTLTADAASFTLAGQAAGLTAQRTLAAAVGSFSLTGIAATLTYAPAGAYTLTADAGTFALSGVDAGLTLDRMLGAGTGAFVLTGIAASLTYASASSLIAETGAFTLSGQAAGLLAARVLTAATASYALGGIATGLTYSGAYRGQIRLSAARGPGLSLYPEAGPALRFTPAPSST